MIKVEFKEGSTTATVEDSVWEYDYGQTLQIEGLDLPEIFNVDFALGDNSSFDSTTEEGTTEDGVSTVEIPNNILATDKTRDFNIYIYIFIETSEETESEDGDSIKYSGETMYVITMPVKTRPKRSHNV